MSGITLERSEFLVLMDAAQARAVVGLSTDRLIPTSREQHQALVRQGLERLQQRGLLRVQGDVNVLDPTLYSLAALVAHPQLALITTRDNPGLGQQLFLHYVAAETIVEQTLPTEQQHRLAVVPSAALVDRLLDILPVQTAAVSPIVLTMPQTIFFDAHRQIEARQTEAARAALQSHGLTGSALEELVSAIEHPAFGGSIALVQCQKDEIVDGYNLALVQGQRSAWLMEPAGENQLRLEATDAAHLRQRLTEHLTALAPRPA